MWTGGKRLWIYKQARAIRREKGNPVPGDEDKADPAALDASERRRAEQQQAVWRRPSVAALVQCAGASNPLLPFHGVTALCGGPGGTFLGHYTRAGTI